MSWAEFATLVNAVVLALVGVYSVRANRSKTTSETDLNNIKAAKHIMDELRTDVAALRSKVSGLEVDLAEAKQDLAYEKARNYALEDWARALAAQVVELRGDPAEYEPFKRRYIARAQDV